MPETFLTWFPVSVKSLYIVTCSWLQPTTKDVSTFGQHWKFPPHTWKTSGTQGNSRALGIIIITHRFARLHPKENGSGQYPVWMTKNPRKGDFRELKSKKYLRETCHWTTPPPPLPRSLHLSGPVFRKPVSIHPSLDPVPDDCAHTWIYMKNLHGLKILKFTLGSGLKALILCSLRSFIAAFMSSTCKKHY